MKYLTIEEKTDMLKMLYRLEGCLSVHPHNEENSEFEDRLIDINDMIVILEDSLKK